MAVTRGDDLVEEIGGLLIQGEVAEFVADEQRRLGVDLQLTDERVIHLRRQQVIEHIHSGGEQHALIRLTGFPAEDLGQEGLAHPGIADENGAGSFLEEVQIEQPQDASFLFHAALVMSEVEAVDGVLRLQTGEAEAALDRAHVASLQFQISERFKRLREAKIFASCLRDRLIQLAAHGGQAELIQFRVQGCHRTPFGHEG